jgi:hypothetical protein
MPPPKARLLWRTPCGCAFRPVPDSRKRGQHTTRPLPAFEGVGPQNDGIGVRVLHGIAPDRFRVRQCVGSRAQRKRSAASRSSTRENEGLLGGRVLEVVRVTRGSECRNPDRVNAAVLLHFAYVHSRQDLRRRGTGEHDAARDGAQSAGPGATLHLAHSYSSATRCPCHSAPIPCSKSILDPGLAAAAWSRLLLRSGLRQASWTSALGLCNPISHPHLPRLHRTAVS